MVCENVCSFGVGRITSRGLASGRLRRWVTVCVAVLLLCGGAPRMASDALAQANSDFISYPQDLTDLDNFRGGRNPRELTFNRLPGASPDYQVGPGDELEITIVGVSQATQVKINGDGEVTIPLLGQMKLSGLTAEQVETAIGSQLKAKQLITNPQVLVYISSYQAKTVYALGEIDRPGEYAVSFQITLMDLIFVAGGIDFTSGRYGYLHRRPADGAPSWWPTDLKSQMAELAQRPDAARGGGEVIRVDLQPMKEGGVLEQNLELRNGDVFYVPKRAVELVYVIGDVLKPGAFELPTDQRMSAARAISWAGGPTKTAKMSKGILVRYEATGQRREYPVDFAAVLKGSKTDVDVRPNDVIFVPGSGGKTLGYSLLDTVPAILSGLLLF